jgi:hypothetical protein
MSFLKLIKIEIEVRLSDQLPFPIYIVPFILDGLFIEPLIIITQVLIVIVIRHDRLTSIPNAYNHFSFII